MSGRCRSHLYSRAMQSGSRGVCVRCGGHEPVRGIVTDKHTYERDMGREHPVKDAFDPAAVEHLAVMRRLLGDRRAVAAPHVPQMARELYPDGYDGA